MIWLQFLVEHGCVKERERDIHSERMCVCWCLKECVCERESMQMLLMDRRGKDC